MFKVTSDTESAVKHFQLALADNNPCSASNNTIKFHIAHLYEAQGRIKAAKERYEALIRDKNLETSLKADVYRQLGWLYHCHDILGDKNQRIASAIHCLQKAIEADPLSGQTLYLLGRCYANIGKVHDAFIAYRNSVEKSEGNADTWCSIGVLYQQQNQPMDALQAYICAVQLDKCHSAAWANLGILYESCNQARDAYACYANSNRGLQDTPVDSFANSKAVGSCKPPLPPMGMNPNLTQRINFLQNALSNAPMPSVTSTRRQLLSIEEAWNLPISAEMSSRQQQANSNNTQQTRNKYGQSGPQGPPPPYPSPGGPAKRFKSEIIDQKPPIIQQVPPQQQQQQQQQPPFYLNPQQQQLLQYLQQNSANLSIQQQTMLQQLQNQYRLMQQHQQQLRQQRTGGVSAGNVPPRTGSAPYSSSVTSPQSQAQPQKSPGSAGVKNFPVTTSSIRSPAEAGSGANLPASSNGDKPHTNGKDKSMQMVQPNVSAVPSCQSLSLSTNSEIMNNDLDVSEEDLKDLLSQRDLATTLAENLLKHFGSEGIDVKEEVTGWIFFR